MDITLFDINSFMCEAWEYEFSKYPNVKVINCSLGKLPNSKYLVTAGNSYGIMNGGIDLHMRIMFGINIQDKVQWKIIQSFGKLYLPVGRSIVVEGNRFFNHLIYTPTMDIPKPIPAENVYGAFLSALRLADTEMAYCGLGANTGRLSPIIVAKQMRLAYEQYLKENDKNV